MKTAAVAGRKPGEAVSMDEGRARACVRLREVVEFTPDRAAWAQRLRRKL